MGARCVQIAYYVLADNKVMRAEVNEMFELVGREEPACLHEPPLIRFAFLCHDSSDSEFNGSLTYEPCGNQDLVIL